MKKVGIIYMATVKRGMLEPKSYIGQTTMELKRKQQIHKGNAKYNAKHKNRRKQLFHLDMIKYGYKNVEYTLLEEVYGKPEDLDAAEQKHIEIHNTLSPNGYNEQFGGKLKFKLGQKTKQKISKTRLQQKQSKNGTLFNVPF